jgi:hypothetical protein
VKAEESYGPAEDGGRCPPGSRVRPEKAGVSFYRVRAAAEDQLDQFTAPPGATPDEATLANNARLVAVDRGRGPYRILYVSGRPNWEFKFLQRALATDDQVQLVGLMRIAKREPKFNFLSRAGEQSNPLFRGFDDPNKQGTGEYDKPVLVRFGTTDEQELRTGFPQTAAELNRYHAVVVDDLEAEFFTQDQLLMLKEFVRQRGGGLLMLGGQESFKNGKFDRTPVGDLLPVYADEVPPTPPDARHRLALTREGWLEPWVRLRGRGGRRAAAAGDDAPVPDAEPGPRDQARGDRARPGDAGRRVGRAGVGRAAVRPRAGGRPAGRRPVAVGLAAAGRHPERPGKGVASDRPLAGGRGPQARRGDGHPARGRGRERTPTRPGQPPTRPARTPPRARWPSPYRSATRRTPRWTTRPSPCGSRPRRHIARFAGRAGRPPAGRYEASYVPRQPARTGRR